MCPWCTRAVVSAGLNPAHLSRLRLISRPPGNGLRFSTVLFLDDGSQPFLDGSPQNLHTGFMWGSNLKTYSEKISPISKNSITLDTLSDFSEIVVYLGLGVSGLNVKECR